jgi:hypothetical protein
LLVSHQQAHALTGLDALDGGLESAALPTAFLADLQDHVARRQTGLARGQAGDPD